LEFIEFDFIQTTILKDPSVSISRVAWGGGGDFIGKYALRKLGSSLFHNWWLILKLFFFSGVAYTKHLIHLYVYQAPNHLRPLLEAC